MKLILACDPNGGIGYENKLPWILVQGDLPRFKELTSGKIVVMGRNTWDSLPKKPLPNRLNVVVTSTPSKVEGKNIVVTSNTDSFTDFHWLIGGAQLINSCWQYINEVHLTLVKEDYECDTFIDLNVLHNDFTMVSEEEHEDHYYQIWRRK